MRIALLTGPSGAGKTFVADQQRTQFHCLSYDRLMRDSIERAFPHRAGDKWDKQVWLDNSDRIDLVRTLEPAFTWQAAGRCSSKVGSCGSEFGAKPSSHSRVIEPALQPRPHCS
jgi:ribose 1,5-bisphosphokinase PhnN